MTKGRKQYIWSILLVILFIVTVLYFFEYYFQPTIKKVYSFPQFIFYIVCPLLIITLYPCFQFIRDSSRSFRGILPLLWLSNVILVFVFLVYFKNKENELIVKIENHSDKVYNSVRIVGRNNQNFVSDANVFIKDKPVFFTCMCREVTFSDTLGLKITIGSYPKKYNSFEPFYSNTPFVLDSLIIRIYNDSTIFMNHDNLQDFWVNITDRKVYNLGNVHNDVLNKK